MERHEDGFPSASEKIVLLASSLQDVEGKRSYIMALEITSAAMGSQIEQTRMDVLANNIANSNTPGYKKDTLTFNDVLGEVENTDMSQGPIRQTGNKLDIALSGSGFLSVQTDQGTLYTRAGDLAVNSKNQLVTQDGWPVLNNTGSPITINKVDELRITSNGQISDGNGMTARLALVDFPANSLEKVEGGYFQPLSATTQPTQATNCTVEQGALETANFSTIEEMANMIEATRYFQAYQDMLKNGNTLDSELIAKLGG